MPSRYWFGNLLSGLVILVLLGWHMGLMHLAGILGAAVPALAEPLLWGDVLARGRSALFTGTYVLLLGTALFHGFYGLRTILREYWPSERAETRISIGCWIAGIIFFAVGAYTTLTFHIVSSVP